MGTREKIIEAIALMDEKGRGNADGNSVMLWKDDWNGLRGLLSACLVDEWPDRWIEQIKVHNEQMAILRRDIGLLHDRMFALENKERKG